MTDPLEQLLDAHGVPPELRGAVREVLAKHAGYVSRAPVALRALALASRDPDAALCADAWWSGLPVSPADAQSVAALADVPQLSAGASDRARDVLVRYRGAGVLGWRVRRALEQHFGAQAVAAALQEIPR